MGLLVGFRVGGLRVVGRGVEGRLVGLEVNASAPFNDRSIIAK